MRIIRSTIPTEWKNFYERIRSYGPEKQTGRETGAFRRSRTPYSAPFLSREPGLHSGPAAFLEISVDGTVVETLELHKDQEYTVKNDQGGVNVFVIRDGKAWVTEASCPDKICMDQGQVSQEGEMIVCLPNRMTARVMGAP